MSALKRRHILTPPRKAVSLIGKLNNQGMTFGNVRGRSSDDELECGLYGRQGRLEQIKRLEVEGPVLKELASGSGLENQGADPGKVSFGEREIDSTERELWSKVTSFGDLALDSELFDDSGDKKCLEEIHKVEVGQDRNQGKESPVGEKGYDAEDEEEMDEENEEEHKEEFEEEYEEYEEEYREEYKNIEEMESDESEWDEDKTHDVMLRGGFKRTPPPSDWDEEQEWYMEAPERDPAFVARRNRLLEALGPAGARLLNMD